MSRIQDHPKLKQLQWQRQMIKSWFGISLLAVAFTNLTNNDLVEINPYIQIASILLACSYHLIKHQREHRLSSADIPMDINNADEKTCLDEIYTMQEQLDSKQSFALYHTQYKESTRHHRLQGKALWRPCKNPSNIIWINKSLYDNDFKKYKHECKTLLKEKIKQRFEVSDLERLIQPYGTTLDDFLDVECKGIELPNHIRLRRAYALRHEFAHQYYGHTKGGLFIKSLSTARNLMAITSLLGCIVHLIDITSKPNITGDTINSSSIQTFKSLLAFALPIVMEAVFQPCTRLWVIEEHQADYLAYVTLSEEGRSIRKQQPNIATTATIFFKKQSVYATTEELEQLDDWLAHHESLIANNNV